MPFYFIATWFGTLYYLAVISGWSELAKKYPESNTFENAKKGWQWGKLNWVTYKGCLWLGGDAQGLHIETGPRFLFGPFHPALCIPWAAIKSVEKTKYWWMPVIKIELADSKVKLMFRERLLSDIRPYLAYKLQ